MPPKYLRKWFYNKVILEGVPESIVDFFDGRSSVTVGSANYMEKTWWGDHFYEQIVDELKETLS